MSCLLPAAVRMLFVGLLSSLLVPFAATKVSAQNRVPILRLEAGGPTSNVTALTFSPDGKVLYAAGFDKVVRVWRLNGDTKRFVLDPATSFRVPIQPGTRGAINALALSPDGKWLAAGGLGVARKAAGFHEDRAKLWPEVGGNDAEMRLDQGVIYLFNTGQREVRTLRGHRGPIVGLAFGQVGNNSLTLASAAEGWVGNRSFGEVRLWDVAGGKQVGAELELPPFENNRPGLALLPGGEGNPAVAITWDRKKTADQQNQLVTGYLKVWTPGQAAVEVATGKTLLAMAQDAARETLYAGSFESGQGHVQAWNVAGNTPTKATSLRLQAPSGSFYFPRSIAALKRADSPRIAVVSRQPKVTEPSILEIYDLAANPTRRAWLSLWKGASIDPFVAGSPTGKHIAIAGNGDHTIWVFDVDQITNDKPGLQILRSVGEAYQFVSFASNQGKLGLVLGGGRDVWKIQKDDRVFEFKDRQFMPTEGWQLAAADQGKWDVAFKEVGGDWQVRATNNGQPQGKVIVVPAKQRIDSYAVLPPRAPLNVPLIILGSYLVREGEVLLEVYNASTGEQIRQLSGHSAPVRSLAFSPDGKLLASAGDDQTVSLWSMADLKEILGKNGGIAGLSVEEKNNEVQVAEVEPTSSAAGTLKPGQVLEGRVIPGKDLQAYKTPFDFYESLWRTRPGEPITVRIRKVGDVKLTVRQGIDIRKPLLSLFVTRTGDDKQPDWLGWNATGPFESSRKAAEKNLGWHFNTGDPKQPAQFAHIEEYRKDYYKEGIIKHLVAQANLPAAMEAWKIENTPPVLPREVPRILDGLGAERADNGDVLFRRPNATLAIALVNYERKPGDVVQWQKDGGPLQALTTDEANVYSIALEDILKGPGRQQIRFVLKLEQENQTPAEYTRDIFVRYQPPAPRIVAEELNFTAAKAKFPFTCKVMGALPDQQVDLVLEHKHAGKLVATNKTPATLQPGKAFDLNQMLDLKEGDNLIEVTASNRAPLAGFEKAERAVQVFRVVFSPKSAIITLKEYAPLDRNGPGDRAAIEPGQPVAVDTPAVQVAGSIASEVPLTLSAWDRGPNTERTKIATQRKGMIEAFSADIPLAPGDQQIRLIARAGMGKEVVQTLDIRYRPELPAVQITDPAGDDVLHETLAQETRSIPLRARLIPARVLSPKPFPLEVRVFANGKQQGQPLKLDSSAKTVEVEAVPLQPGNNTLRLEVSSPWSAESAKNDVQIRYVRPPRILSLVSKIVGETPFVNLTAEVASPSQPLADSVEVEVAGQRQKPGKVEIEVNKVKLWTVKIYDVPLVVDENVKVNKNDIRLSIANAEDRSLQPAGTNVVYNTPLAPRPKITPEAYSVTLKEPVYRLKFGIESRKPLRRVEVSLAGKVLYRANDLADRKASDSGAYEFDTGDMELGWGYHQLRIDAINEGGPEHAAVVVSVPSWPVKIDVSHVELEDAATKIAPTFTPGGKMTFARLADGRAILHGKIQWSSRDDERMKEARHVHLYVNGYQQLPARLAPYKEGERVRSFEAPVRLPFAENRVELELPGLVQDSSNRSEFALDCKKPARGQRLHVVVIAPEESNERELRGKMMKLLGANPLTGNLARSGVFDVIHFYSFTDYVELLPVLTRLHQLGRDLKSRAVEGFPNDVVLVYFWGRQTTRDRDHYLWTSDTTSPARLRGTTLSLNHLENNYFKSFPGAQILCFDLQREDKAASWVNDARFALLAHSVPNSLIGPQRFPLLTGLAKSMPAHPQLDPAFMPELQRQFNGDNFQHYLPRNLKVHWHGK